MVNRNISAVLLKSHLFPGINEAGCDEAGRGCLAGPVFAAAVILPGDYYHPLLDDSKKLTPEIRALLRPQIERDALAWAVACVDNEKIDEVNILQASIMAMHLALDQLKMIPEHILIDGNYFKAYNQIPHTCIIQGDGLYASIAAASILAKTCRDDFMINLHKQFPHYGWEQNKGYPTVIHRSAIMKFGITPYHRKSFSLFDDSLELIF